MTPPNAAKPTRTFTDAVATEGCKVSISVKEEVMQIGTPVQLEQRESAAVAPPPESEAGGDSTVTPTGSGVELPEPAVLAEHRFHWPEIQQITGYTADQLRAYADARVVAATKALKDWRFEVCERLGLSCAAGAEWSPDQIWQHVTDVEIALNQRAESAERERDALRKQDCRFEWLIRAWTDRRSLEIESVAALYGPVLEAFKSGGRQRVIDTIDAAIAAERENQPGKSEHEPAP